MHVYSLFLLSFSDTEVPVFTNCSSSVINMDRYVTPAAAGFNKPTATDNSGLLATMTVTPSNFNPTIPLGVDTNVTYVATDQAGNSATCALQIKINREYPFL